jgi:CRP/FNR family transcriptional regulator
MEQRSLHSTIHCQNCSISQLCIPYSLNGQELDKLDDIIQRKRPFQKHDQLYKAGDSFTSLYAVRSGSFKTYTISPSGEEQITGFHLPGDIIGFDGIHAKSHPSFAQALETSMVCEIPFDTLESLSGDLPKLRHQVMRLMSDEIASDQQMMLLLNKKSAEQRLATFLHSLASRYGERGFSSKEFRLSMTRGEIGNYLGLTVETISRLLSRFQKEDLIVVQGKLVSINDTMLLQEAAGIVADCEHQA